MAQPIHVRPAAPNRGDQSIEIKWLGTTALEKFPDDQNRMLKLPGKVMESPSYEGFRKRSDRHALRRAKPL